MVNAPHALTASEVLASSPAEEIPMSNVAGGGAKPWKQKGTGRARQGSIRAPQWKGGGVALGPKPRDYRYALNKKTRRLALKSALTAKVNDAIKQLEENGKLMELAKKYGFENVLKVTEEIK